MRDLAQPETRSGRTIIHRHALVCFCDTRSFLLARLARRLAQRVRRPSWRGSCLLLVPIKLRTLTGRPMAQSKQRDQNGKMKDLAPFREDSDQEHLTTDQGLRINDDQNSLKAGERGGSLLEDFILREKITHFNHERIPER